MGGIVLCGVACRKHGGVASAPPPAWQNPTDIITWNTVGGQPDGGNYKFVYNSNGQMTDMWENTETG
jgi:hypothetical protein